MGRCFRPQLLVEIINSRRIFLKWAALQADGSSEGRGENEGVRRRHEGDEENKEVGGETAADNWLWG